VTHREALKAIADQLVVLDAAAVDAAAPASATHERATPSAFTAVVCGNRAAVLPVPRAERPELASREAEITVVAHCTDARR